MPPNKRRQTPSPNSILDRPALEQALDDYGLTIKSLHLDTFYQALHRQHYPDLQQFVQTYYQLEEQLPVVDNTCQPLRQAISAKKNTNKGQLPQAFLQFLNDPQNGFVTVTSQVAWQKTSQDQSTTKMAIELHDGQLVEAVLMRYQQGKGRKTKSRASLCVSSQCGCAMGCVSI